MFFATREKYTVINKSQEITYSPDLNKKAMQWTTGARSCLQIVSCAVSFWYVADKVGLNGTEETLSN